MVYTVNGPNIFERQVQGNVTVAYYFEYPWHPAGALARISKVRVGNLESSLDFEHLYIRRDNKFSDSFGIHYNGVDWTISKDMAFPTNNDSPQAKKAHAWAAGNDMVIGTSPERTEKCKILYDKFYDVISTIPIIMQYVQGSEDFYRRKEQETRRNMAISARTCDLQLSKLNKEYRLEVDPLDEVIRVIDPNLLPPSCF